MLLRLWLLVLLHLAVSMAAAQTSITVRLYSLHPEKDLKLTARTGDLQWRTCPTCPATAAKELPVRLAEHRLQIKNGPAATRLLVEGNYRIEPERGLKAALTAPLELKAEPESIIVLASVPLEDYVAAALEGESAVFHEPESLKAMAVAARTYAVHFRARHQSEGFDLCDSTHCQALIFTAISARVRAAVEATRGELLWYKAEPAATYYHQNCGGTVAAGREVWPDIQAPYLKSHTDPFCLRATPLVWRAEFSRTELDEALRRRGLTLPARWISLEISRRSESGRVLKLVFLGPEHSQTAISASSLRFAIGRTFGWNRVRSDFYKLENSGGQIVFRGRGAGHGVGLCQTGAEQMAREGKTYRQILDFYYPGIALGVTAQGLAWQERQSDHFQLLSTQPEQDAAILTQAEAILESAQSELGWRLDFTPQLRVFPTLEAYRNATGQPGWIAAFTRGHTISLQPVSVLRAKSVFETTLRHEFVHLLVESHARADTPLWFREGLTLFLAEPGRRQEPMSMSVQQIEAVLEHPGSRESLERCYAAARTRVARLIEDNGWETVLGWLSSGLPGAAQAAQH